MALPNVQIGLWPLRGQAKASYPEGFQVYADRAGAAYDEGVHALIDRIITELQVQVT